LHWLQIGDGPDLDDLIAQTRQLGLDNAVTFAGRRSDIADLLETIDIWVMSSIRDGLPLALLEAMAARKPIVATQVGGIPDAIEDGESGLLVNPSNSEEMAKAIIRLCQDPEEAARLAKGARCRAVEAYSIEAVASQIEQIYRSGLQSHSLK